MSSQEVHVDKIALHQSNVLKSASEKRVVGRAAKEKFAAFRVGAGVDYEKVEKGR